MQSRTFVTYDFDGEGGEDRVKIGTVTNYESRPMPDNATFNDELFIHLDLDGLLALMKAAEAAIATGRGRLELCSGGIAVSSGTASFARVTLTVSDPAGGGLALAA